MKKIIALLLIIGCLAMFLSLPVGAVSSANDVDFIVNAEGDDITIDVKTNFACGSLQGALKYDASKVSYSDINFDSAIDSKNPEINSVKNVKSATKFAFVGDVKDGTTGNWATLSYTGNSAKFDIENFKAYAANGTKVDAKVYIVSWADSNTDSSVDLRDLVVMKKFAAGTREIKEVYKKNIDIDNNGQWEPAVDMAAFITYLLSI